MKTSTLVLASLVAAGTVGVACSIVPDTCEENTFCEPDGGAWPTDGSVIPDDGHVAPDDAHVVATPDAQSDATGVPPSNDSGLDAGIDATPFDSAPPCDPTKTPAENACVIADGLAIFVAPTGSDATGTGTMEAPVATIATAITLAKALSKPRVIACTATYAEMVSLASASGAVSLFGGVTCPGSDAGAAWTYTGAKTVVAPSAHGYALSLSGVTQGVEIDDFGFEAQSGTAAGESSIAGFVSAASGGVTFVRASFVAGVGVDGTSGATPTTALPVATAGTAGSAGGAAVTCTCTDSGKQSVGGAGGTDENGSSGTPELDGGAGGDETKPCIVGGGNGENGASAAPVSPAAGAASVGAVTSSGWSTVNGSAGTVGGPGQGGGGGASPALGATGGAGGCGGCGGAGATPGLGGGSSIALLVYQSAVTLTSSSLTTKNAGGGGGGKVGQTGAAGGTHGIATAGACNGGDGAEGAQGGASGGGAGGLSVGIVWTGTAPTVDAQTTFTPGTAGAKGIGGATPTNDGVAGVAQIIWP